jgi:hypothetical protein
MEHAAAKLASLLLLAALAGCAAVPRTPTARAGDAGVVCTNSVPVGSVLREYKCTTAEDRERERRQSDHQIVIERVPRSPRDR